MTEAIYTLLNWGAGASVVLIIVVIVLAIALRLIDRHYRRKDE